jgi:prefoldin subunit 5
VTKFKRWLFDRFLPAYCRDGLCEENDRLERRIAELAAENKELRAYINGIHTTLRTVRRITPRDEVKK